MRTRRFVIAGLAALALAAAAAPAAQAREIEGEVIARNGAKKTFTIQEDEGGRAFKVKVNRGTSFQGVNGFKAVRVGRTDLEVTARKSKGRWIATVVETRGGGGDDD